MHKNRLTCRLKSSSPSRLQHRQRQALRLGTCLSGAAAALLLANVPVAAASPGCGILKLTAVTCPEASTYSSAGYQSESASDKPRDLTVRPSEGINLQTHDLFTRGVIVSKHVDGAAPSIADAKSSGNPGVSDLTIRQGDGASPGAPSVSPATVKPSADVSRAIQLSSVDGPLTVTVGDIETSGPDTPAIHEYAYGDITIVANSVKTTGYHSAGIYANNNFGGTLAGGISVEAGDVFTSGDLSSGIWATAYAGNTSIKAEKVITTGENSLAIYASSYLGNTTINVGQVQALGKNSGGIVGISGGKTTISAETVDAQGEGIKAIGTSVDVTVGSLTTHGDGDAWTSNANTGILVQSNLAIDNGQATDSNLSVTAGSVHTEGAFSDGIDVINLNRGGAITIGAGTVTADGDLSFGVGTYNAFGDTSINFGDVSTKGYYGRGIDATGVYGDITISGQSVSTKGDYAYGILARTGGQRFSAGQAIAIDVDSVATEGFGSDGIRALSMGRQMTTTIKAGSVKTSGDLAYGILAYSNGSGNSISIDAGSVETSGKDAIGIQAINLAVAGDIAITTGSVVTTGEVSAAIFAYAYDGNIAINAGSVTGGSIGASSRYGDIDVVAGTVSSDHYGSTGISVSGQNVSVKVDKVEETGTLGVGVMALGVHNSVVEAGEILTTTEGGFGVIAEGTNVNVTVGKVKTTGLSSTGVYAGVFGSGNHGVITVNDGISTSGQISDGVFAISGGTIAVHNAGSISTSGESSRGIAAFGIEGVTMDGSGVITTSGDLATGVLAQVLGGTVSVAQSSISTTGNKSIGLYAGVYGEGLDGQLLGGSVSVDVGAVSTLGDQSHGIVAVNFGKEGSVAVNAAAVTTEGNASDGIQAFALNGDVLVKAGNVRASGDYSDGIIIDASGNAVIDAADVSVAGLNAFALEAFGGSSAGITSSGSIASNSDLNYRGAAVIAIARGGDGLVHVTNNGTIHASGRYNGGIYALSGLEYGGRGGITISSNSISTKGWGATGIYAGSFNGHVEITSKDISTDGDYAVGIRGYSAVGGVTITSTGALTTHGQNSYGVLAFGSGENSVFNTGSIATHGEAAHGIYALGWDGKLLVQNSGSVSVDGDRAVAIRGLTRTTDVTIRSTGDILAQGERAAGIVAIVQRSGRTREIPPEDVGRPFIDIDAGKITVSGDGSVGIFATNYRGGMSIKAGTINASKGSMGLYANSVGTTTVEVGDVSSGGRGILASSYWNTKVTVSGSVIAPNHVAVELNSWAGDSVLNVASGAVIIGGGHHDPIDDPYVGPGNAVILGAYGFAILNNAGTITNQGDADTIRVMDFSRFDSPEVAPGGKIFNSGLIEGNVKLTSSDDLFVNTGRFVATKDSDFGDGSDRFVNSGTLAIGQGMFAKAGAAGPLTVAFRGLERFENSGLVDLRGGAVGDALILTGDYAASGDARLGLDVGKGTSDKLVIEGTATGSTGIILNQSATDATLLKGTIQLVSAGAGTSASAFSIATPDVGLIHYGLAYNAGFFSLKAQAGAPVYRIARIAEGAQAVWDQSAQAWSGHMTQLRDNERSDTRLWGQAYGGVVNRDRSQAIAGDVYSLDYRQDFYGFQAGLDLGGTSSEESASIFGLTGGYISSHQNFQQGGERAQFSSINLGAYGSVRKGAVFANLLGQYDHHSISTQGAEWTDKTRGSGYGVQGEIGARFGSDKLFIEPLASLSWQQSDIDRIKLLNQSVDFAKLNGLNGKLGARIGGTASFLGTKTVFYGRGAWVHQFGGRPAATLESGGITEHVQSERLGDYAQATLGMTILSDGPVSGFVEGTATFGSSSKGGGGRAGVRFKF